MMSIFSLFKEELPPFKKYLQDLFDVKEILVVNKTTGMRVHQVAQALAQLFYPVTVTNKECTPRVLELVVVSTRRLRDKLLDHEGIDQIPS